MPKNPCFQDIDPALPVVAAGPGYFRIAIDPFDPLRTNPFCPLLDPVVAWRVDYYAVPVTADELSDLANYAILRPDGRVTYPFKGEFATLEDLVASVNRDWDGRLSCPSTKAANQDPHAGAEGRSTSLNRSHVTDLSNSSTVKS